MTKLRGGYTLRGGEKDDYIERGDTLRGGERG